MESTETSQEIPDENYSTLPFSHQDPLGLNDLAESQGPTYNYSLDDGLHNFVIPVSSNSSSQYVIASNSFSLAPIVKKLNQGIFFSNMIIHTYSVFMRDLKNETSISNPLANIFFMKTLWDKEVCNRGVACSLLKLGSLEKTIIASLFHSGFHSGTIFLWKKRCHMSF